MEHFVRQVSSKCAFPRESEIEEDVNQVLELDVTDREKFMLKHFLLHNMPVLKLNFHLTQLTTKPSEK